MRRKGGEDEGGEVKGNRTWNKLIALDLRHTKEAFMTGDQCIRCCLDRIRSVYQENNLSIRFPMRRRLEK
jgi:hypothetical protein